MKQKATQELIDVESHEAFLVVMSGVSPAESNPIIVQRHEAVVGDGNAMGVSAQVAEHLVGSAEGWLTVNHPVMPEQLAEELPEELGLSEGLELSVELEFACREGS
jgi:hypothetical protein